MTLQVLASLSSVHSARFVDMHRVPVEVRPKFKCSVTQQKRII